MPNNLKIKEMMDANFSFPTPDDDNPFKEEITFTISAANISEGNITNITFRYDIRKDVYSIMMPVVLSLCFISLLLSTFVVCAIPFIKRPMSPTIRLSLSLCAANATFSAIVFICTIIHSYAPAVFNVEFPNCLNLVLEVLRLGVILVQVYHLLAVALTHYFGTLRPLQYASTLTPYTLKIIVFLLWTIPIFGMFVGFCSVTNQGFQSPDCSNNYFRMNGIYFRYIWSSIYFGPTIILILVYVHIFFILNQRRKLLEDSEHRRNLRKNLKTVKTTALIVVSFLIGWTPAVLSFLLICKDCYINHQIDIRLSIAIFSTSYILFILKVFVDTFIYALRLPEIREGIRQLCANAFHCFKSSHAATTKNGFYTSSTGSHCCKSTYISSIRNSSSFASHKGKSLKSLTASTVKRSYVTMEMKPLFEKVRNETIAITFSGSKSP